ncbi:hypothetical protein FGU71_10830 [Erythrobacter insulae]|uniref:Uncharacterized protein n=1 Tax=Erythrobacter insulae TaxID=2584124 RepID=A0A547PDU2_9SPHN|nr:hypothetical protein [Erythrobacter insulae]TRD12308.1 hypothetical protein FGU71_10830 [Erythrobacter insulae]
MTKLGEAEPTGTTNIEASLSINGEILRYVRPSDTDAGIVNGSAFERKPKDVDGVSVTRANYYSVDDDTDIECVRTVIGSNLNLAKTGLFARLPCDGVREIGTIVEAVLDVLAAPTQGTDFDPLCDLGKKPDPGFANDAHAIISGLPFAGSDEGTLASELAGDLLCRTITKTYGISA